MDRSADDRIGARSSRVFFRCAIGALLASVLAHGQRQPVVRDQPLVVVSDGKYGYIDHGGRIVIKPQFHWADTFSDGFATAYVCGKLVSIDGMGKLHPRRLENLDGLEPRFNGSRYGYADAAGNLRIQPLYEEALPFSEGLAAVAVRKRWGFIDTSGRVVIPPRFDAAFYFFEGVAVAEQDGRFVLIDRGGKTLADGYDAFGDINEGRVPVHRADRWGFLDRKGNPVIPLAYDGARRFDGGLAPVSQRGRWGYIDIEGRVAIPFQFDEAGSFHGGTLAAAKLGTRTGFIDRHGKFRFFLPYRDSPGFIYGDVAPFWTDDGRFGYVNETGKTIWTPRTGSPDHAPLFGWTEEDARESCDGLPESVRRAVAAFPPLRR